MTRFEALPYLAWGGAIAWGVVIAAVIACYVREERRDRALARDVEALGGTPAQAAELVALGRRDRAGVCSHCGDTGEVLIALGRRGDVFDVTTVPCSCPLGDARVLGVFAPATDAGRRGRGAS